MYSVNLESLLSTDPLAEVNAERAVAVPPTTAIQITNAWAAVGLMLLSSTSRGLTLVPTCGFGPFGGTSCGSIYSSPLVICSGSCS